MPDDNAPVLAQLTDRLADILAETGVAAERQLHCVAIGGTDIQLAVTAIWENPHEQPEGAPRVAGVEVALHSPTLFDTTAYEYSYGGGRSDEEGLVAALESWAAYDLPVLTEAASGSADVCSLMEMRRNAVNGIAPGTWRITAGPLVYRAGEAGTQPCCRECLLAMSMPSLLPLMTRPKSFALKLVASKDEDGTTSADCRRNGEDVPEAIAAIAAAAADWPVLQGLHMRRQYLYFKAPPQLDA